MKKYNFLQYKLCDSGTINSANASDVSFATYHPNGLFNANASIVRMKTIYEKFRINYMTMKIRIYDSVTLNNNQAGWKVRELFVYYDKDG